MLSATPDVEFHKTDIDIQRGPQNRSDLSYTSIFFGSLFLYYFFCLFFAFIGGIEDVISFERALKCGKNNLFFMFR